MHVCVHPPTAPLQRTVGPIWMATGKMEKAGCREYCQLKLQSDELSVLNSMTEKKGGWYHSDVGTSLFSLTTHSHEGEVLQ